MDNQEKSLYKISVKQKKRAAKSVARLMLETALEQHYFKKSRHPFRDMRTLYREIYLKCLQIEDKPKTEKPFYDMCIEV